MLITPAPGANRRNVLDMLRSIASDAGNLQGGHYADAYDRLLGYLEWATKAARRLRNQISPRDLDQLILTRGHAALLAGAGHLGGSHQQRLVNGLVDLEVSERITALDDAVQAMEELVMRWPDDDSSIYLVPDTSFYIHHPQYLEKTDFTELLSLRPDRRVHLLFPMVVVDELDTLKESKNRDVRWRASSTVAVLDRILNDKGRGVLREPSGFGTADVLCEISVEVLFDQPGHVRLPLPDDEIVDRCAGANVLAGSQGVRLLTYDTGQSTRARFQGLRVHKYRNEAGEGDEPDGAVEQAKQNNGTQAKRRERQQQRLETRERDEES